MPLVIEWDLKQLMSDIRWALIGLGMSLVIEWDLKQFVRTLIGLGMRFENFPFYSEESDQDIEV